MRSRFFIGKKLPSFSAYLGDTHGKFWSPTLGAVRGLKTFWAVLIVALVAPVGIARAAIYAEPTGDAAAWLFSPNTIVSVSLDIPQESLDSLAIDPYTYVPMTFTMVHGVTTYGPWNIEGKIKGRIGSYRPLPDKSAFKLKFSNSAQRISGLKKLTLNNMVQDPSKVHETVVYRLFRAMGVPAPRTGFANLSINGDSYGLYLNVETPDNVMLPKWYGASNTKHLYEGSYFLWNNQFDPFDVGYEVDEGDELDRSDLQTLYTLNNTSADAWFDAMDDIVDFENVVRMWAVERYSGHWDGYSYDIVNNFYFHSDAAGIFTMLPWGTDQTWGGDLDFSSVRGGSLFVNCMNAPECRRMYVDAIEDVRDVAESLNLATYASEVYALIRDHLVADPKKPNSIEDSDYYAWEAGWVIGRQIERVDSWLSLAPSTPILLGMTESEGALTVNWLPSQVTSADFALPPYPVTGYKVFWRRAGSPFWRSSDFDGPELSAATISALANGVEYEVKVAAVSQDRVWPHSDSRSFVLGLPSSVRSASAVRNNSRIRVRWMAPESFGAASEANSTYRVEMRSLTKRRWNLVHQGPLTANKLGWHVLRVRAPRLLSTYEFRIRVETDFGESSWSTVRETTG